MEPYTLILASGSPRRKELLKEAGYSFRVEVSDACEEAGDQDPARLVERLAEIKALAVAEKYLDHPDQRKIIIGADTIVVHRGQILGKPEDKAHAVEMIRALAGDVHQVYTGVSLLVLEGGRLEEKRHFHERTDVHVRAMEEREILSYVEAREPVSPGQPEKGDRYLWQDKAGGYGIQTGWGARMISGIRGDYYNVVGLPVCRLSWELDMLLQGKPDRS